MIVCMRLFHALIFLTLVGSTPAFAAPVAAPVKPGLPREQTSPDVQDPTKIETIQAAPAGEPPAELPPVARTERYFPEGLSLHLGFLGGQIFERDETTQSALLGAQLSRDFGADRTWDFQFDIGSDAWLRLGTGRRFHFLRDTRYRPYWKLALFQTCETDRVFAGFVDLERVKFVGALGLADLLEQEQTMNVEFGLGAGLNGVAVQMQFGWAL